MKIWITINPDSLRESLLAIHSKNCILLYLKKCYGDSVWTTLLKVLVSNCMCINIPQVYIIRTDMNGLSILKVFATNRTLQGIKLTPNLLIIWLFYHMNWPQFSLPRIPVKACRNNVLTSAEGAKKYFFHVLFFLISWDISNKCLFLWLILKVPITVQISIISNPQEH